MKNKKKPNPAALASAIKQQQYDMDNQDHIEHHRDNQTNRKRNGLPNRRKTRSKHK